MPYRLMIFCLVLAGCHPSPASERADRESLAECLARTGAHLYGASWCPACHEQLMLFGPDASEVPYTDCDPSGYQGDFIEECPANGVPYGTTLPIWIFPDGSRLTGVRDLATIADVAGCPFP